MSDLVVRLQYEILSLREQERLEREKLVLQFENALLKFGRQLPPAKEPKKLK